MIKIITAELNATNLNLMELSDNIVIDAKEKEFLINHMLNITKSTKTIEIWDVTKGHSRGTIVEVSDHINKTGSNPLTGNQQKLRIDFPELSNLYQNNNGVVTSCLGAYFNDFNIINSSTWLCHISIVGRAVGIKTIKGRLVST